MPSAMAVHVTPKSKNMDGKKNPAGRYGYQAQMIFLHPSS